MEAPRRARPSAGSSGSTSTATWKLPSPTWPTIGAGEAERLRCRLCVSAMHSARAGHRDAHVGGQALCCPGRCRAGGVVGAVARVPEAGGGRSRRSAHWKRAVAVSSGDLLDLGGLRLRPGLASRGTRGTGSARPRGPMLVVTVDLRRSRGVARVRCGRPGSPSGGRRRRRSRPRPRASAYGHTAAAHRLGRGGGRGASPRKMEAERPLRADEQARQVVAGGRLARPRAGSGRRCRRRSRRAARSTFSRSPRNGPWSCPTRPSAIMPPIVAFAPGSSGEEHALRPQALVELLGGSRRPGR